MRADRKIGCLAEAEKNRVIRGERGSGSGEDGYLGRLRPQKGGKGRGSGQMPGKKIIKH